MWTSLVTNIGFWHNDFEYTLFLYECSAWTKDPKSVPLLKCLWAFFPLCLPESSHHHVPRNDAIWTGKKVSFHLNPKIVSQILFLMCVDSVKKKIGFGYLKWFAFFWETSLLSHRIAYSHERMWINYKWSQFLIIPENYC